MKKVKKVLEDIIKKQNLEVKCEIIETKDDVDIIYVQQQGEIFYLYINYTAFKKKLPLKTTILHEVFHIKQYLEKFPMLILLTDNKDLNLIQNIVTDFFVTKEMCYHGYSKEAKNIFIDRMEKLKDVIIKNKSKDILFKAGYILSESKEFFYNTYDGLLYFLEKQLLNEEIEVVYQVLKLLCELKIQEVNNDIIIESYTKLINIYNKHIKINIIEDRVLIISHN